MCNLRERAANIFSKKNIRKRLILVIVLCEVMFSAVCLSSSTKGIQQPVLAWRIEKQRSNQSGTQTAVPTPEPTSTPSVSVTPSPAPEPTPVPTPTAKPAISPVPQEQAEPGRPLRYPILSISTSKPVVFLTMDDGYDSKAISAALAVLREREVRCTFFIIGDALRSYPALWKQAVKDGHLICNHTATHKYLSQLSEDGIDKEISGWEDAVADVLGEEYLHRMKREFPYLRLPGGMGSNSEKIMGILADKGYIPVGWSIETVYEVLNRHNLKTEPVEPIARQITDHVTASAKSGSIILLHFNSYDVLTLDKTLQGITEKGLEFKLIPEAFGAP